MSNAIRYDSLLVRALGAELNRTLTGARLERAFLDRERLTVALRTRAARRSDDGPPSLLWHLHPESGHLVTAGADTIDAGRLQLRGAPRIAAVSTPPDERILILDLDSPDAPAGMVRRIIIELITNQWNAIAVGADERIVAVLRERQTRTRTLRAGVEYVLPPGSSRAGATEPIGEDAWLDALAPVPPGERLPALLRFAAYTSPLNAPAILGDADVHGDTGTLLRARERYETLVRGERAGAVLVRLDERWQPYPVPLPGHAEETPSLLAGFAGAAERSHAAPAAGDAADRALAALDARMETVERRLSRLRGEAEGAAEEAEALRRRADVLLSQLHRVPRGAARVELDDFEGGVVELELDPSANAADNATRMYETARRRDRAAERIPRLVRAAERERQRLRELADRVRAGTVDAAELEQLQERGRSRGRETRDAAFSLPYREYRTTGGIEIRVGRGSRSNDDLTFRHSSPTDIWLHARDVAGAHVILRWPHAQENPPSAAIAEAAVLAALHSRARTSSTVAVDWTRRKHVRKPRRAAPGLVIPERVRTVFVEPDARLEERLRADESG